MPQPVPVNISKIMIVFSADYPSLFTAFLMKRRKRQKQGLCQKLCLKFKSSWAIAQVSEVKKVQ